MKTKNIILTGVAVILVIIVYYSFQGSQDDPGYMETINKERMERDRFMRTSDESPIPDKQRFQGLQYFPVDSKYRIIANLTLVESKKPVVLATSDGNAATYLPYAYADFDLDGMKNRLLILEAAGMAANRGELFLAFADATSARETYGGGRYLDVKKTPGSTTITLDFNKAYNPYCAYNNTYSCPFPPEENILTVAVRAGEKKFHE